MKTKVFTRPFAVVALVLMLLCSADLQANDLEADKSKKSEHSLPENVSGQKSKKWYKKQVKKFATELNIPLIQLAYKTPDRYFCFESAQFDFVTESDCTTVYQACSVSKVVFSYLVLYLYDKGIIDLDKPLWEYLGYVEDRFQDAYPDNPAKSAQNVEWAKLVTARMVLTHGTGLPNWAKKSSPSGAKLKFAFKPDAKHRYSGEGMWYLQRVIEHITGSTLEQLARKYIFDPLGMTSTSYEWREEYAQQAASGYYPDFRTSGQRKGMKSNSAYSMRTNVRDFSRFIEALMEGKFLKPETHKMMLTAWRPINNAGKYFGLGIRINPNEGTEWGPVWGHTGSNRNFRCRFWIMPEKKTYMVYFTNSANGGKIHPKLMSIFQPNYNGSEF